MGILNIIGTLKDTFFIGKGSGKVDIRTNSGVLEGRDNGGDFKPLLNVNDAIVGLDTSFSSQKTNSINTDLDSNGRISGGEITRNSTNLNKFDVASGYGYVIYNGEYKKVTWTASSNNSCLTSEYTYISIDPFGALALSSTKQTSPEYVNLGHLYLNSEINVITTIWNLPDIIGNYANTNQTFVNNCFGTIVACGLNVMEQSSPNQLYLTFSEGELWISLSKFDCVEQTNFTKILNSSDYGITLTTDDPNKVDTLRYNDVTQLAENALVEMTTGYWKKDLLVMNPDKTPYYLYGDTQYATQDEAINAPHPVMSAQILADGNAFLFNIVCQKGDTSIANRLYDVRPMFQRVFGTSNIASGGTVVDYNDLINKPTVPTNTNQLINGANFITLTSLSADSPLSYSDTTGALVISQSSVSQSGYLSATDWGTFNSKLAHDGNGSELTGITASQVGAISSTLSSGNTLVGNVSNVAIPVATKTAFNVDFETTLSNIKANGSPSLGALSTVARADHIHPIPTVTKIYAVNTNTQSISSGVVTKVNFTTENIDDNSEFSGSTFTSKSNQTVLVSCSAEFASISGDRSVNMHLYKNGSSFLSFTFSTDWTNLAPMLLNFPIAVATGDTLEIYVYHSDGNPRLLNGKQRLFINKLP